MREYLLYIKVLGRTAQAHITPCFHVDQAFWREREGARLYVIGKSRSLALAFYLRGELNAELSRRAFSEKSVGRLRQIASSHVREANVLYGRRAAGMTPIGDRWFSFEAAGGDTLERRALADGQTDVPKDMPEDIPMVNPAYAPKIAPTDAQTDAIIAARSVSEPSIVPEARSIHDIPHESAKWLHLLNGRALLWEETASYLEQKGFTPRSLEHCLQWNTLLGKAERRPGIEWSIKKSWLRHEIRLVCARCGSDQSVVLARCHTCEQGCGYCTECLDMGRSKCCTPYICVPGSSTRSGSGEAAALYWRGQYSPMQKVAAEKARQFAAATRPGPSEFLLWAVCGAGKTELLFPSVAETLRAGGRVLIATPRKDVVLELAPRIRAVFPAARVIAVHGSSREKWEDGDITIATTHQVMRYYQRFPLVVLDEVDAFPYHNNPVLYRVLARAVQPGGKILYLSATPPRYLQKRLVPRAGYASQGSSTHVLLPGRYHGSPLPVPRISTVSGLYKRLTAGRPIPELLDPLAASLGQERQVFVFVPRVDQVERVLRYLQEKLPAYAEAMAGVHAADPEREEKVRRFRAKELMVMITTTILERGVTIPRSDVIVMGAEAPVFDEASLVQIAGRVGRSADAPDGTVLFLEAYRTSASRAAVRQIRRMNLLAARMREAGDER